MAGERPSGSSVTVDPELPAFLVRAGLAREGAAQAWSTLGGGVSSDIWRVDLEDRIVCVKRALAKLRVAQDWRVPVDRNAFEAEYLRVVADIAPGAVPRLLARGDGLFAMPAPTSASFVTKDSGLDALRRCWSASHRIRGPAPFPQRFGKYFLSTLQI